MERRLCNNCGIELDPSLEVCPLCASYDNPDLDDRKEGEPIYPSGILASSNEERKRNAWEIAGVLFFSAITVCIIVDLVIGKGLNWSLYAITSFFYIWSAYTLFLFFARKLVIISSGLMLITSGTLCLFDLYSPPVSWFVGIGLPITIAFSVLLACLLLLAKKSRHPGFNLLAYLLIALALLALVIEIFTDLHIQGKVDMEWSAIAAASVFPFSSILLFLHFRFKRGRNLGSFFHI